MSTLKPLIVVLGPTASGKSELALKLALRLSSGQAQKKFGIKGVEIVSADSRQIYRQMDIGTAKPYLNQISKIILPFDSAQGKLAQDDTEQSRSVKNQKHKFPARRDPATREKIKKNKLMPILINKTPHYLIDIINPDEDFSVAEYKKLAIKIIRDIQRRGKVPFLVGGTGLYISAVVDNLKIPEVPPNPALRKKLEKMPLNKLLKKLQKLNPDTFETIDKKNKRRLIRALEVTISNGKPFSKQKQKGKPLFDVLQISLKLPRKILYKKIDARVNKMIKAGLIQETKNLLVQGYSPNLPSMSGIGYREAVKYLKGEVDLKEAIQLIKYNTHHYVRRQMTWFRRDKRIKWVNPYTKDGLKKILRICKKFLN